MQIKNVVQNKNIDPVTEERQAIIKLINDDKIAEATSLSESLILKYPSIHSSLFYSLGMGFTFDLQDLGRYYGMYLDMMDHWRQKFPGRIYELDYRDLTENQEEQTRLLLDHCDLPWEDAVLDFHKTRRGVLTASQMQVR